MSKGLQYLEVNRRQAGLCVKQLVKYLVPISGVWPQMETLAEHIQSLICKHNYNHDDKLFGQISHTHLLNEYSQAAQVGGHCSCISSCWTVSSVAVMADAIAATRWHRLLHCWCSRRGRRWANPRAVPAAVAEEVCRLIIRAIGQQTSFRTHKKIYYIILH